MAEKKEIVLSKAMYGLLKRVSRTLYLSIKIMPEPVKTYMGLGYLMCRALDSIVDTTKLGRSDKLEILELACDMDFKNSNQLAESAARLSGFAENADETELLSQFGDILALYFKAPEARQRLLKKLLSGIAEGMKMDISCFDGQNLSALQHACDLKRYCRLIGGIPGIFWASLYREYFIEKSPKTKMLPKDEDGCSIGCALQITNILKDLSVDIANGRCYIPFSDLLSVGLLPKDLKKPENFGKIKLLLNNWLVWGVKQLDQAERFIRSIPKRELALRAAVIWPVYWSEDTLAAAARVNTINISERPKISRSRIYSTLLSTPPLLLSNTAFARGYRFRRETLMSSISSLIDEEDK